jgi:hypothetical protein
MNPKRNAIIVGTVIALIAIITCIAADAPPIMYLILIGMGAVVFFIVAPIIKQSSEMLNEGKIITRDANFMKNAQIFTLSKVSIESLVAAMKTEGLPFAGLAWKAGNNTMTFSYNQWAAQMIKLPGDDGYDKFRFSFTRWQTMKYGQAVDFTQMNQLLTAIEKALLKLDPSTKVQTEQIKVNTKSSF